jgi:hypothetical protein
VSSRLAETLPPRLTDMMKPRRSADTASRLGGDVAERSWASHFQEML